MKRYYYELLDSDYCNLGCFIPDGNHISTAINRAKRFMKANDVTHAVLEVNSLATSKLLNLIDIDIEI